MQRVIGADLALQRIPTDDDRALFVDVGDASVQVGVPPVLTSGTGRIPGAPLRCEGKATKNRRRQQDPVQKRQTNDHHTIS